MARSVSFVRSLVVLLPALTLISCADAATTSVAAGPRATWEEAGIESYTFILTRGCFCPQTYVGPFAVTVVDGEVTSVLRGAKEVPLDDELLRQAPLTVDELFEQVDEAEREADDVAVSYDPELGYPTTIAIDRYTNAVDDEMTITVEDLRPSA